MELTGVTKHSVMQVPDPESSLSEMRSSAPFSLEWGNAEVGSSNYVGLSAPDTINSAIRLTRNPLTGAGREGERGA